ncbi:MAG TPA: WecB/TagA/CpsF family glycosyltransferase [Puia sp.]|jgi:N-acetylglucosaminyldiphosphoundecaprenol N-acetyl-beta-D-mannosaminyltransferase|nr:WecB/TagA/CpsF family glycosyltransferase [Puia sp.]
MPEKLRIISLSIDRLSFRECLDTVIEWGKERKPSYVCFANVHMIIEAYRSPAFLADLDRASLVVADGKPLTAACYSLYRQKQERISGMDFMPAVLAAAGKEGLTVFLYGSTPEVLDRLGTELARRYPALRVGGMISPPFRPLSPEETDAHIAGINQSGAQLLLVSLGCPKQERWMAANYQKIRSVCLGVGGAFPVMAQMQRRAPRWMQNWGLEWLYRLILEPRRMFPRYLKTNSLFIYLMGVERLKQKRNRSFTIKPK